jgi:hypothetical protein
MQAEAWLSIAGVVAVGCLVVYFSIFERQGRIDRALEAADTLLLLSFAGRENWSPQHRAESARYAARLLRDAPQTSERVDSALAVARDITGGSELRGAIRRLNGDVLVDAGPGLLANIIEGVGDGGGRGRQPPPQVQRHTPVDVILHVWSDGPPLPLGLAAVVPPRFGASPPDSLPIAEFTAMPGLDRLTPYEVRRVVTEARHVGLVIHWVDLARRYAVDGALRCNNGEFGRGYQRKAAAYHVNLEARTITAATRILSGTMPPTEIIYRGRCNRVADPPAVSDLFELR